MTVVGTHAKLVDLDVAQEAVRRLVLSKAKRRIARAGRLISDVKPEGG